jgi:hypothetical protein
VSCNHQERYLLIVSRRIVFVPPINSPLKMGKSCVAEVGGCFFREAMSRSRKPQELSRDRGEGERDRDKERRRESSQSSQQTKCLVDPTEIPKLSFSNIQNEDSYRSRAAIRSPPLQKRGELDRVEKGYPPPGGGIANKLSGSGKFPSLAKNTEYSSGNYQNDLPKLPRESRRLGGKLPPRELQPIAHSRSEKFREGSTDQFTASGNNSLQRNQGGNRSSLQPLNAMLKSNSLSKIDRQELPPQRHVLETNIPLQSQKKALAPLHHSGRQQLPSTRPW